MATRPDNKHGVTFTPFQGTRVLVLTDGAGAAQALTSALNKTDGSAVYEGEVRELPMVINGDLAEDEVLDTFGQLLHRLLLGRKLLEVRDPKCTRDASGVFFTATALWAFEVAAPAEEA